MTGRSGPAMTGSVTPDVIVVTPALLSVTPDVIGRLELPAGLAARPL